MSATTIDELMVVTLARAFTNETRAFNGAVSFVPVCAYLLARRTHAPELVWAALDCPSGWAVDDFQREGVLLGRMATEIERLPASGEPHVVLGWRIGGEGRKRFAGSALLTGSGRGLARSRSTWIVPAST